MLAHPGLTTLAIVVVSAAQPLFLAADRTNVLLVSTLAIIAVSAARPVSYTADRGNVLPRDFENPGTKDRMNYRQVK